jgi:hypothetical protein
MTALFIVTVSRILWNPKFVTIVVKTVFSSSSGHSVKSQKEA